MFVIQRRGWAGDINSSQAYRQFHGNSYDKKNVWELSLRTSYYLEVYIEEGNKKDWKLTASDVGRRPGVSEAKWKQVLQGGND